MIERFNPNERQETNSNDAYEQSIAIDKRVQLLDPLELDSLLIEELPRFNMEVKPEALIERMEGLSIDSKKLHSLSPEEAMAATRDLSMVASSLRRHNRSLGEIPYLESALITLSKRTLEVPADTVFSYGTRNPIGERTRTFTTFPEERLFIDSFREGMVNLPLALSTLEKVQNTKVDNLEFAPLVREVASNFEAMVSAIVRVRKAISPEFFTKELRPYFEPKTIGGRIYKAPGGAQMPIILIDQALWGASESNPMYLGYYRENLAYQPHILRDRESSIIKEVPIITRVFQELESSDLNIESTKKVAIESLTAAHELLLFVEQFRRPHLKIAQDNMALRPAGAVGSGGYDIEILEFLLTHISAAKQKVAEKLKTLKS